ncbi:TolC family outer membrane protein [Simiduia aestuariiviva]|uniref:Adhesin transport system outer membrane protein n=1 Tax=Simiduia aestuariiviva TaxID=1510459 RepID=A0A839UN88_9GAMM|nr:TolC family outer membrane protein [Simiduia aestuariiviva]MBB3168009.1 adhesin transport system outer membrane protein [Simiduia aestuariiviva]
MIAIRSLIVASVMWGVAASSHAISLQDAVKHTLESHPEILAARHEINARKAEVRLAKSGFLPRLDATAGVGYEETRKPSTQDDVIRLTRNELSLQARQMVFDGFATSDEVDRQTARVDSASYLALASTESVTLRTAEVYLNLLRQLDLMKLAKENLKQHQNIYDQMVLRNRSGVGSRADLDQISARLALANSNLVVAENNLLDARTNFYRVVGFLPDTNSMTMPDQSLPLPATMEAAVGQALERHPTLLSAVADVNAAQAQYEASDSSYWPQIQLEADKRLDNNIGGVEGEDENLIVALRMRYNLFNGGADKARRSQTAYLLEEAREIRNNTHRQVVESMRLSWSNYEAVSSQLRYLQEHVRAATSTRKAYQQQFNIGRRTLLDLLNTENEVLDSKRALIGANYDRLFAQYRILNAMGDLTAYLSGD